MILIISDYPSPQNEKEGMMQRIAAIDRLFKDQKRIYLDLCLHPNWLLIPKRKKKEKNLQVWQFDQRLSWLCFLPILIFFRRIYVHSIFNSAKIGLLYRFLGRRIVTDMHGVVPEELQFTGSSTEVVDRYNRVEKTVVERSHFIVTVSDSMRQHFCRKYKDKRVRNVHLPIFDQMSETQYDKIPAASKKKHTLLYSGGSQQWQNVDLMIESARVLVSRFHLIFLTGDVELFGKKLSEGSLMDDVELKIVGKDHVYQEYRKADFGLILRDDHILNRVSCPTKLVEYLTHGLIPVVLQPEIGDFHKLGYDFVLLHELLEGKIPDDEQMEAMRLRNYIIARKLSGEVLASSEKLKKWADSGRYADD